MHRLGNQLRKTDLLPLVSEMTTTFTHSEVNIPRTGRKGNTQRLSGSRTFWQVRIRRQEPHLSGLYKVQND
jgi:hypothetical protein